MALQVITIQVPGPKGDRGIQGPPGAGSPDATTTTKGSIQLAGDLGGTAAAPTVPGLAGKAATTHTHTASQLSDASAVGRSVLTATDAAAARTALGAGTSSLVIGTTGTTAAAGNDSRLTDQRVPTDGSVTNAKVASAAAISLDKTADSATRLAMTAAERTKLSGLSAYTDEQAQDAAAAALVAGSHTGVAVEYNDAGNAINLTATGTTSPDATTTTKGIVQLAGDLAGTAAAPTVPGLATKASTSDARFTDQRVPTDGSVTNAKVATDAAIALSKLATDPLARANHTGTQASTTISDLTESVQDIVGAFLKAGTGTTVAYDDVANTFTITATAGGGTTDPEIVRDVIGAALVAGTGIQIAVNDAGDTLTIASTAVLPTRTITTTAPLAGGGDLSANRTLTVDLATTAAPGVIEVATNAETAAGDDGARAVTPNGMRAANLALHPVVLKHNGTAYPTRPTGAVQAVFIGSPDPGTAALDGDEWVQI